MPSSTYDVGINYEDEVNCIGQALEQKWQWEFMLLGYTISVFGAFIGLTTTMIALTVLEHPRFKNWFYFFIFSSGVSIGFTCVWTMHFVGMQALELRTCNGTVVEIHFNVLLTMVSLIAAILISSLCIFLALPVGDKLKTNKVSDEQPLLHDQPKRRRHKKKDDGPEFITLPMKFKGEQVKLVKIDFVRFGAATIILMIAVCIMHFMGMLAQYGPYKMKWDAVTVFGSVLIALGASGAGLFIVVQISYTEKTESLGLRLLASFIIGAAVNAMHYTGMSAASYEYNGDTSKALTHILGPNMNVPPAWICLVSMVSGVVMMLLSQHYSDLLYVLQKKFNEELERKLPKDIQQRLEQIYADVKDKDGGARADYIPCLANANPDVFGITLCDLKGNMFSVGDVTYRFSIQSCCKPLLYMLAIEEAGAAKTASRIGQEPSGQPFDALSIDPANRAYNPYVNAGAMVSASLIASSPDIQGGEYTVYEIFEDVCKDLAFDDERIQVDDEVYTSEMATNDNNRGIATELLKRGILASEVQETLEAYTLCCAMLTTCEDMAVMAATFANHGKHPMSEEEIIPSHAVDEMVTVMMSCGMYNGAGKWIVDVGLPAKSGVAGAIMCVVPGVCGLAVFSPRLDENGNSTRGVLVAKAASEGLGLHVLKSSNEESTGDGNETASKGTRRMSNLAGKSRKGSVDGSVRDGSVNGSVRNGSVQNGSVQNGKPSANVNIKANGAALTDGMTVEDI